MNDPNRPDRWRIDMNEQEQLKQLKEEYENMTIPETGTAAGRYRQSPYREKKSGACPKTFRMDCGSGSCDHVDRTAKYQYADRPCHGKYSGAGRLF